MRYNAKGFQAQARRVNEDRGTDELTAKQAAHYRAIREENIRRTGSAR
jgi:hypothetical protein